MFLALFFSIQFVNGQLSFEAFSEKQNCYNSSDGVLKYIDEGNGDVIVLLHGVPTSGWLFRNMIPDLVNKGYRVIVPDMLGFGNSDSPAGEEVYSPANHAKRLLELMDVLEIEKWSQVVHDAGSIWTFYLMAQSPQRIERLTFLNAIIDESGVVWSRRYETRFLSAINSCLYNWGLKKNPIITKMLAQNTNNRVFSAAELEGYEFMFNAGKNSASLAHYQYMEAYQPNIPKNANTFNIPVQVIWGQADEVLRWKPQAQQVMEKFAIEEQNVHLLNANHFIPEELPQQLDSLIVAFINQ